MIEPTAEMIALFDGLPDVDVYSGDTVPAILRDLLAIIERNQAGPCSATLPRLTEFGDLWCQLRHGHLGDHEMGPTRWKDLNQSVSDTGSSLSEGGAERG